VKRKVYLYQIFNSSVRPVLYRPYAWFVSAPLNFERMRKATVLFKGTHDFSSFCSTHSDVPDHIRTIMDIRIESGERGLIKIEMEADGFLRYMVRSIVGILVDVGRGKYSLSELQGVMDAKDRKCGGITAPAHGLFLKEVRY